MRMAVDNAGHDDLSRGVDHLSVFWSAHGLADFSDFAVLNKDGAVFDRSVRDGQNGSVSNQNDGGRLRRVCRACRIREVGEAQDAEEGEEPSPEVAGAWHNRNSPLGPPLVSIVVEDAP